MNRYLLSEILAVMGALAVMLGGDWPWLKGNPDGALFLQSFGVGLLVGAFVAAFFPDEDKE
jgi:hypothetical protein